MRLAAALDFDQLIYGAQIRSVRRSYERAADAERVNSCAAAQQSGNFLFVQITGGEYLNIVPAGAIEFAAHPAAVRGHVSAVEADAGGLSSRRNNFFEGSARVVSIEQKRGMVRKNIQEAGESLGFTLESHDP